jgi:hypothetical protein
MIPSLDVILETVGYGLLVPAAVTVVGLLLALRLGGAPLAVGVGLAAGFAALVKRGQTLSDYLKPEEAGDWLPALGLLACVAAFVEQRGAGSLVVRWSVRLIFAALTAGLLVRVQSVREPIEPVWYGALALAVLALWGVLDLAARRPERMLPALLALAALSAGVLAELAGLSTIACLAEVVAGALIGCALIALWRPRPEVCRAGVPMLAVLLPGFLFLSYFNTYSYSSVPPASYWLLLAAPLCLGVASLLPLGQSPLRRAVVLGTATLVPLAVALALAAPRD